MTPNLGNGEDTTRLQFKYYSHRIIYYSVLHVAWGHSAAPFNAGENSEVETLRITRGSYTE